jgi:hypothetical protein
MIQAVETGSITALAAIADLSLFLALPTNNLHLIPYVVLDIMALYLSLTQSS